MPFGKPTEFPSWIPYKNPARPRRRPRPATAAPPPPPAPLPPVPALPPDAVSVKVEVDWAQIMEELKDLEEHLLQVITEMSDDEDEEH